jgi:hypothetical protein
VGIIEHVGSLGLDQIENVEQMTTRWLFQAIIDFSFDAFDVFYNSPDDIQDIAEDITREVLDRLSGYNIPQRVFGTVDYKRARYIILPDQMIRQALFIDSKAEKENRTATIQMSQTSMVVRQYRSGSATEERGQLPVVSEYGGHQYLTTTAFLHFCYEDIEGRHHLKDITVCCIPNGMLQDKYNPDADTTIWLAGRNAPTRGEVFRVRLGFKKLKDKCPWRVQGIHYDESSRSCYGSWDQ